MVKFKIGEIEVTTHVSERYSERIMKKSFDDVSSAEVEEKIRESVGRAKFGRTKEKNNNNVLCYFDEELNAAYILKEASDGSPQLRTIELKEKSEVDYLDIDEDYR